VWTVTYRDLCQRCESLGSGVTPSASNNEDVIIHTSIEAGKPSLLRKHGVILTEKLRTPSLIDRVRGYRVGLPDARRRA
jgi:hypothetical protein